MSKSILINHNGKDYRGEIMTINSTRLGWEDHGILTVSMALRAGASGVNAGGFCLDSYVGNVPDDQKPEDSDGMTRVGTAYGLDHIMRIMHTVGVEKWEDLVGKQVIALDDASPGASSGWGARNIGIAGLTSDRVLVFKDHAESWADLDKKLERV